MALERCGLRGGVKVFADCIREGNNAQTYDSVDSGVV
jgi:hypothetical protein